MLDKEKLEALEEEFEAHPDGLEAKNFVWYPRAATCRLMKCAMNYRPDEKFDLVHGLQKLFAEIDINGDHKMEWSEFTQYVIDAVMQDHVKAAGKDEAPTQKEMLEQAHSKKFVRFSESSYVDTCVHEGIINKIVYIPSLDRLMLVESRSPLLKFMSLELKKKEVLNLRAKELDSYPKTGGAGSQGEETERGVPPREEKFFILAAAYNERDSIVLYRGDIDS